MTTYIVTIGLADRNCNAFTQWKAREFIADVGEVVNHHCYDLFTHAVGEGYYEGAAEPCATWVFSLDTSDGVFGKYAELRAELIAIAQRYEQDSIFCAPLGAPDFIAP